MTVPTLRLRPGRAQAAAGRHPWVFSGSLASVEDGIPDGAEVRLTTADGAPIGYGLYNSRSQIRVRLYSWDAPERPAPRLDEAFWRGRVDGALALRHTLPGLPENAPRRWIFSEGDGLSGLTVDGFGEWLTVQLTSLALHRRLPLILDLLEERLAPRGILLRTEKGVLEAEGLEIQDGLLRGEEPEGPILLEEMGFRYQADLRTGQKTGFYLDQRENRARVAAYAGGRRAADLCCYSGGFALHLARGGATDVIGVDVSAPALELAEENARLNGVEGTVRFERSDALRWMTAARERGDRFGLIVLDPPRFARSRKGVAGALRGYARLNEAAVELLEPGGILATCSCSGRVNQDEFAGVLGRVSERTGRAIRILERLGQPADHPVDAGCPESAYLKCLIAEVEG